MGKKMGIREILFTALTIMFEYLTWVSTYFLNKIKDLVNRANGILQILMSDISLRWHNWIWLCLRKICEVFKNTSELIIFMQGRFDNTFYTTLSL